MIEEGPADETHPRFGQVKEVSGLLKDRIKFLTEAPDLMSYFLQDELADYDSALLIPKKVEPARALEVLQAFQQALPELELDDLEGTEARLRSIADDLGLKAGQMFMPIRVAACGRAQSPGLFETLRLIGNDRLIQRVETAVRKLQTLIASA
jgi:glutamyl-tRNA synthetase